MRRIAPLAGFAALVLAFSAIVYASMYSTRSAQTAEHQTYVEQPDYQIEPAIYNTVDMSGSGAVCPVTGKSSGSGEDAMSCCPAMRGMEHDSGVEVLRAKQESGMGNGCSSPLTQSAKADCGKGACPMDKAMSTMVKAEKASMPACSSAKTTMVKAACPSAAGCDSPCEGKATKAADWVRVDGGASEPAEVALNR